MILHDLSLKISVLNLCQSHNLAPYIVFQLFKSDSSQTKQFVVIYICLCFPTSAFAHSIPIAMNTHPLISNVNSSFRGPAQMP